MTRKPLFYIEGFSCSWSQITRKPLSYIGSYFVFLENDPQTLIEWFYRAKKTPRAGLGVLGLKTGYRSKKSASNQIMRKLHIAIIMAVKIKA